MLLEFFIGYFLVTTCNSNTVSHTVLLTNLQKEKAQFIKQQHIINQHGEE